MFDIGWSELLVIAAVALVVIGPKELPGVLRAIGHWTTKIRRMASEFQGQFQEAMREAEMADLKKTADELNETARSFTSDLASKYDPFDVAKESAYVPKPATETAAAGGTTGEVNSTVAGSASSDTPAPADPIALATPAPADTSLHQAAESDTVAAPPALEPAPPALGGSEPTPEPAPAKGAA
jgi:sec-independent protein translocase protein TatB